MKHEGSIESIRQRLLNLSRASGESFDYVLARYGIERVLYRLSKAEMAEQYVLKGATLFHVWNKKLHRPTRDLDLLGFGPNDSESLRGVVLRIIHVPCLEDGLTFDEGSLVVAPIREDSDDGGVRAKFRAMLETSAFRFKSMSASVIRLHQARNCASIRRCSLACRA